MSQPKSGEQTVVCSVISCKHNCQGNYCDLSRVQIEPMTGCPSCHNGIPADESLCGSYKAK